MASTGVSRRRAIFEEAVAAIEQSHAQDRPSLAEIARTIFTSKRQLQRAFAEAGTSFQATLHAVRMERSAELLVESSLPVSAIAHQVGYQSPTQFTKAFRRHYQLAPSQLRKTKSKRPTNGATRVDCGRARQRPDSAPASARPPRPRRGEQRELERRLEQVDRRLQELTRAA